MPLIGIAMAYKWSHSDRVSAKIMTRVDPNSVSCEVLVRTDKYAIAAWRRLLMLIWKGEANAEGVERSRRVFEEWVKSHERGGALLIVVPPRHASPPDEETREAMRQAAEAPCAKLKGMGTFIQSEGFIAATIRSAIIRLNVLTGDAAPNVFETASRAAAWAARILSDSNITADSLADAIRAAQGILDSNSETATRAKYVRPSR